MSHDLGINLCNGRGGGGKATKATKGKGRGFPLFGRAPPKAETSGKITFFLTSPFCHLEKDTVLSPEHRLFPHVK